MTTQTFTQNEQTVLDFILAEEDEPGGWGPTLREIVIHTGQTKAQVKGVLGSLAAKNAVESYKDDGFPTVFNSMTVS